MKTKLLRVVAALALLGVAPAGATTYVYSGNPMSVTFGCCQPPSTTFFGIFASVQFNFDTVNTSGTYDQSSGVISTATLASPFSLGGFTYPSFPISVTLNGGVVTGWSLSIFVPGPGGSFTRTDTSGDISDVTSWFGQPFGATGTAPPGTWSGPISDAFSVVPLPAALPLFATGLGALGLLGWRRKRKQAANLATAP
jgi:hypothetical protein